MSIAEVENPAVAGQLYQNLGVNSLFWGKNIQQARIYHQEAYQRFAERGNYWAMCHTLYSFGMIALMTDDLDEAEHRFTEALSLAKSIKFQLHIDDNQKGLSRVAQEKGDWETAHSLINDIKRNRLRSGFPQHCIFEYDTTLAYTAMMLDEAAEAKSHLIETTTLYDKWVIPIAFDRWAIIASAFFVRQNDFLRATKLAARVNPERPQDELTSAVDKHLFVDLVVQCREALSPEEFEAAWERGQTMTNEEAIALVAEALR
jgi:tetratricopeptide (TPR) repeat protein